MKLSFPLLLILLVAQCPASTVAITTTSLPNGIAETTYSAAIAAGGGCKPYKWAIVSGDLPAGVAAKTSNTTASLELTGDPTTAASYSFTVSVTGCGGHVSTASYTIVIQVAADHVVDLSWDASTSSDVIGYNVYRAAYSTSTNSCGSYLKINSALITTTAYTDAAVTDGDAYCYAATAVNSSEEESGHSNIVSDVQIPAP